MFPVQSFQSYALLSNKTTDTYRRLLTRISEFRHFQPASLVTDFAMALIKAFSEVFPGAARTGCFYHFSQCIFRQVQSNVLLTEYNDNEFSLFIWCLSALAFVPLDDVVNSFDALIDAGYNDQAQPVVNYFEDNFIGRPDRRGIRKQPIFSIASWNVYDRVLESLPRTNNSVEGWHNGFQRSLMCSHPTIWRLIEHLKKEDGAATAVLNGTVTCWTNRSIKKGVSHMQYAHLWCCERLLKQNNTGLFEKYCTQSVSLNSVWQRL